MAVSFPTWIALFCFCYFPVEALWIVLFFPLVSSSFFFLQVRLEYPTIKFEPPWRKGTMEP